MSEGRTIIVRRGATILPNRTVYDARLSISALGVLALLLARPEVAPSGYRELEGRGLGRDALLKALRELDAAGYRHQRRRNAARGRIVTDTIVCEEPMTVEEAIARLDERAGQGLLWPVDNPSTVRRNPAHGATRQNVASAQVAPRAGSPERGGPRHGGPAHRTTSSNGSRPTDSNLEEHQAPANAGPCPHGYGLPGTDPVSACAICRRRPPGVAPWDLPSAEGAKVIDFRARAAGEHIEHDDEEDT